MLTHHSRIPRHFTLVELLIVISIILILMSILLPALKKSKLTALSVNCKANLRQIGIASDNYAEDYDDYAQYAFDFSKRLVANGYMSNYSSLSCPAEPKSDPKDEMNISYGINYYTFGAWPGHGHAIPVRRRQVLKFGNSSNLIYIADSTPNKVYNLSSGFLIQRNDLSYPLTGTGQWYPVYTRHSRKANCLMFDLHVADMTSPELADKTFWRPWQQFQVLQN